MGFVKCFIEALRIYIEVSSPGISLSLMTQLIFITSVSNGGNAFLVFDTWNILYFTFNTKFYSVAGIDYLAKEIRDEI